MADAADEMNDFRMIKWAGGLPLEPALVRQMHLSSVQWLQQKLGEPFAGTTVVVTHHLPHPPEYSSQV